MKGDYWEIKYRVPNGIATERIVAEKDGSSVDATFPGRNESWLMVEVLNKAGQTTRTARFAQSEVIAIVQGHEQLKRKK